MQRSASSGGKMKLPAMLVAAAMAVVPIAAAGCGGGNGGGGGGGGGSNGSGLVEMLLPENVTERWEAQDKPFFIQALKKYAPNAKVEVQNALNDQSKQQSQAEAALVKGAKVLVVIPVDQKGAARIATKAKQQGASVVAYDRLILGAPIAAYVSVDGVEVGKLQGQWLEKHTKQGDNIAVINGSTTDDNAHLFADGYMSVLKPLFSSGDRKQAANVWTPGWEPPKAQSEMEQILTRTNNNIEGVLSANDGMAQAIIAALRAQGLAGKVPVTGLDGTGASLNLILKGQQGMSVYRSLREQADKTAQIVAALLKGQKPPANLVSATKDNGAGQVPWAKVTPHIIDASNANIVIKDGAATKAQVCKGIPSGKGPC